jgi:hypothetical protein
VLRGLFYYCLFFFNFIYLFISLCCCKAWLGGAGDDVKKALAGLDDRVVDLFSTVPFDTLQDKAIEIFNQVCNKVVRLM